MLRLLVVLLLLVNGAYFLWTQGHLAPLGLAPVNPSEPQHLAQQIKPEALTLVCSANGGMKLLASSPDADDQATGQANQSGHALDCPLCLALDVPLMFASVFAPFESPLAPQLQPTVVAHLAVVAGAPLPPRGPPAHA